MHQASGWAGTAAAGRGGGRQTGAGWQAMAAVSVPTCPRHTVTLLTAHHSLFGAVADSTITRHMTPTPLSPISELMKSPLGRDMFKAISSAEQQSSGGNTTPC